MTFLAKTHQKILKSRNMSPRTILYRKKKRIGVKFGQQVSTLKEGDIIRHLFIIKSKYERLKLNDNVGCISSEDMILEKAHQRIYGEQIQSRWKSCIFNRLTNQTALNWNGSLQKQQALLNPAQLLITLPLYMETQCTSSAAQASFLWIFLLSNGKK